MALKKIPLKKVDDGIPNSALRFVLMHVVLSSKVWFIVHREIKALQESEENNHVSKLAL